MAEVEETSTDLFGLLHMLHTFNGVDFERGGKTRDWIATRLWTVTMDLLSLSLILWVSSGIFLWLATQRERLAGKIAMALGMVLALAFVAGPAWIF